MPLYVFGYIFKEALDLHPQPLTSTHIQRKLGVGRSSATLLKRRLQLFMSDLIPTVKHLMVEEIKKDFDENYRLPHKDVDVTELVKSKNVVFSDTLALFSVSRRANGYRSRYKHNGQTSSIYLTPEVAIEKGKYQIGTLVHTLALKKGLALFSSIPDQTQTNIEPLIDWLPKNHVHFSDEGFPYLQRSNDNYRAVNHSARAKNGKRNVWARHRWSKNGVHNQTAEGIQRVLKLYMRCYSWVDPRFSSLFLSEFSALRALRLYGLSAVAKTRVKKVEIGECSQDMPVRLSV